MLYYQLYSWNECSMVCDTVCVFFGIEILSCNSVPFSAIPYTGKLSKKVTFVQYSTRR